ALDDVSTPFESPVARLERAAQLVGERSEPVRGCPVRALAVLAHLVGLARILNRLGTEADASSGRIQLEDDDLDVGSDRKRFHDVAFLRDPGLAQRDETRPSGSEEHEDAELLVAFDLSHQPRTRDDLARRFSGARRALRKDRDADALLVGIDV